MPTSLSNEGAALGGHTNAQVASSLSGAGVASQASGSTTGAGHANILGNEGSALGAHTDTQANSSFSGAGLNGHAGGSVRAPSAPTLGTTASSEATARRSAATARQVRRSSATTALRPPRITSSRPMIRPLRVRPQRRTAGRSFRRLTRVRTSRLRVRSQAIRSRRTMPTLTSTRPPTWKAACPITRPSIHRATVRYSGRATRRSRHTLRSTLTRRRTATSIRTDSDPTQRRWRPVKRRQRRCSLAHRSAFSSSLSACFSVAGSGVVARNAVSTASIRPSMAVQVAASSMGCSFA